MRSLVSIHVRKIFQFEFFLTQIHIECVARVDYMNKLPRRYRQVNKFLQFWQGAIIWMFKPS